MQEWCGSAESGILKSKNGVVSLDNLRFKMWWSRKDVLVVHTSFLHCFPFSFCKIFTCQVGKVLVNFGCPELSLFLEVRQIHCWQPGEGNSGYHCQNGGTGLLDSTSLLPTVQSRGQFPCLHMLQGGSRVSAKGGGRGTCPLLPESKGRTSPPSNGRAIFFSPVLGKENAVFSSHWIQLYQSQWKLVHVLAKWLIAHLLKEMLF